MVSGIAEIVNELNDSATATVDIPLKEGDPQRLDCVLKKTESPSFKLIFLPNALDFDNLVYGKNCHLVVKHGDGSVNLNVQLDKADGDRTLHCTALASIKPESLREYFRVMINAPIRARYEPGPRETKNVPWELSGQTIDLSGSGVLALFPGKPASSSRIQLELDLPGQEAPIICQSSVVRTYRMRKKRYQVAFYFEEIDGKARDLIISCCLKEQRRQLRDKVRVK